MQGKMILVGMPEHTMNVLMAIARVIGKSAPEVMAEAIDLRAKEVLGADYLQKVPVR